jgi:hypothetical protein
LCFVFVCLVDGLDDKVIEFRSFRCCVASLLPTIVFFLYSILCVPSLGMGTKQNKTKTTKGKEVTIQTRYHQTEARRVDTSLLTFEPTPTMPQKGQMGGGITNKEGKEMKYNDDKKTKTKERNKKKKNKEKKDKERKTKNQHYGLAQNSNLCQGRISNSLLHKLALSQNAVDTTLDALAANNNTNKESSNCKDSSQPSAWEWTLARNLVGAISTAKVWITEALAVLADTLART